MQAASDQPDAGLPLPAPVGPNDLSDHYDLTISHPSPNAPQFAAFDRWLSCAAHDLGLSCALIHDAVVQETVRRLGAGRMTVGYHLDYHALWHVAEDPYARLAEAVVDADGRSVNPPARSRAFTDKASAHSELTRYGLGTPTTVILRPWTPDRALTADERRRLRLDEPGACAYVKPANGFSGAGVTAREVWRRRCLGGGPQSRPSRSLPDTTRGAAAVAGLRRRRGAAGVLAHLELFGGIDAVLVGFPARRRPGPAELPACYAR